MGQDRVVQITLLLLIATDTVLAGWAWLAPEFWFQAFHGVPMVDPQGLLRRMGANWTAFLALQLVAAFRWRREPFWLAVVAGARLGDCLTDWTYLAFAQDLTWFAWLALGLASPANLVAGGFLLKAYRRRAGAQSPL